MKTICYYCEEQKECGMFEGSTICKECMNEMNKSFINIGRSLLFILIFLILGTIYLAQ